MKNPQQRDARVAVIRIEPERGPVIGESELRMTGREMIVRAQQQQIGIALDGAQGSGVSFAKSHRRAMKSRRLLWMLSAVMRKPGLPNRA